MARLTEEGLKRQKKLSKETQNKIRRIDECIENLQNLNVSKEIQDEAALFLLKAFHPLVVKTVQALEKTLDIEFDEIAPTVDNMLIKIAMEYLQPRTDTQGRGLRKGEWAPNFNVYVKKNLYFFSKLELMKDLDGPGIKNSKKSINMLNCNQQLSAFDEQNVQIEASTNDNLMHIYDILDYIEDELSEVTRDFVILKYIYKMRNYEIKEALGLSNVILKQITDLVKLKVSQIVILNKINDKRS